MKGGITEHGEESQGREEEGRQEAVTSLLYEQKGATVAPFSLFCPTRPAAKNPADDDDLPQIAQITPIEIRRPTCPTRTPITSTTSGGAAQPRGETRTARI